MFELKKITAEYKKNYPALHCLCLNTGQMHLLALVMVLSKEPKFLILLDPTAGLDDKNVDIVTNIITKLKNEIELSILLIEHRTQEIRSLADRRVEIDDGEIIE